MLAEILLPPQSVPVVDCSWQGVQGSVGQQGEAFLLHQELALVEPDGFRRGHGVVEVPQESLLGRGGRTQTPQGIGRCGAMAVALLMPQPDHCRQGARPSQERVISSGVSVSFF